MSIFCFRFKRSGSRSHTRRSVGDRLISSTLCNSWSMFMQCSFREFRGFFTYSISQKAKTMKKISSCDSEQSAFIYPCGSILRTSGTLSAAKTLSLGSAQCLSVKWPSRLLRVTICSPANLGVLCHRISNILLVVKPA